MTKRVVAIQTGRAKSDDISPHLKVKCFVSRGQTQMIKLPTSGKRFDVLILPKQGRKSIVFKKKSWLGDGSFFCTEGKRRGCSRYILMCSMYYKWRKCLNDCIFALCIHNFFDIKLAMPCLYIETCILIVL